MGRVGEKKQALEKCNNKKTNVVHRQHCSTSFLCNVPILVAFFRIFFTRKTFPVSPGKMGTSGGMYLLQSFFDFFFSTTFHTFSTPSMQ